MAACLSGDSAAWDALIGRYQGFIFALALRQGLSSADADDVFQDVCLKLFRHLDELRDVQRLSSWLGAIVRQEVWRRRRRPQPEQLNDLPAEGEILIAIQAPDPESAVLEQEQEQLVRMGLGSLSETCRSLLGLLYGPDDVSYAEAAEQLSMPIGSIGPRRARCLDRLRKELETFGF